MSFTVVFSVIHLLLVVTLTLAGTAAAVEGRLDVKEAATTSQAGGTNTRELAERRRSELVSRRGWYGSVVMPWNNLDMAWLKRAATAATQAGQGVERRGWGNGIPPWMMQRRVIVLPATAPRRRADNS